MAKFDETPTRLEIVLGSLTFNGARIVLDRSTQQAHIERTNLFFKSKPLDVPFSEIAEVQLRKSGKAHYPRLLMTSGRLHAIPSFASEDAKLAVPRMQAFLAAS